MSLVRIAVAASVVLTLACRQRERPDDASAEGAGEPQQYSALVVRVVDDGKSSETIISRETRAGEYRREEWTEDGQNRALIWRPDIGKAFLLDLERKVYVEIDVGTTSSAQSAGLASNAHDASTSRSEAGDAEESAIRTIDKYFDDTQTPTRVETRALSPALIDGHPCGVYERKAVFPDGHTETTRRFHARDLSGLLLRVETLAEQGGARVITERRDVQMDVAPDAFIVPEDFKRVEKLTR
ncbi:MAG TPA: hypothetical protein VLG74_01805 [Blastocatellia bacterium]|nr:hypothetical protein [Blastocatellia bacterium]